MSPAAAMMRLAEAFAPEDHPHAAAGSPTGGQFTRSGGNQQQASKSGAQKGRAQSSKKATAAKAPAVKPKPTPKPTPPNSAVRAGGKRKSGMRLGRGSSGPQVQQLQGLLALLKLGNPQTDGAFGPDTEAAVMAAQQKLGMHPNGRVSSTLLRRLADSARLSPCIGRSKEASVVRAADLMARAREADWNPADHPRVPGGTPGIGGQFASLRGVAHALGRQPHEFASLKPGGGIELGAHVPRSRAVAKMAKAGAPTPRPIDLENAARVRQAEIDKARATANFVADIHERIANGQGPETMRTSITAGAKQFGIPDHARDQMLAKISTDGGHSALAAAADALGRKSHLTPIGRTGDTVVFDPKLHKAIGSPIRQGTTTEIVSPGHWYQPPGGDKILIAKAVAEEASSTTTTAGSPLEGRTIAELRQIASTEGLPLPTRGTREQLAQALRDQRFHRDNPTKGAAGAFGHSAPHGGVWNTTSFGEPTAVPKAVAEKKLAPDHPEVKALVRRLPNDGTRLSVERILSGDAYTGMHQKTSTSRLQAQALRISAGASVALADRRFRSHPTSENRRALKTAQATSDRMNAIADMLTGRDTTSPPPAAKPPRAPKIDHSPLTASDRAHHIISDSSLTTRQKRSRMRSQGLSPAEIDALAPLAAKTVTPATPQSSVDIAAKLRAATSRDEANGHLDGLTAAQLKAVAAETGVLTVGAGTKAAIRHRIVEQMVGFRLDSAAIRGF